MLQKGVSRTTSITIDHSQPVIGPPDGRKRVKMCYGLLTQATDTGFLHLWADSMATVECEKSHCHNTCCRGVRGATLWEAGLTFSGIILINAIVCFQTRKQQRKQQTCESAPVLAFWKVQRVKRVFHVGSEGRIKGEAETAGRKLNDGFVLKGSYLAFLFTTAAAEGRVMGQNEVRVCCFLCNNREVRVFQSLNLSRRECDLCFV